MRKLFLYTCAVVLSLGAMAQEFETIFTSKGEKYIGYISEQVPGISVSVYAIEADMALAKADVKNFNDEYRYLADLPAKVQVYFDDVEEDYVKLHTLTINNQILDDLIPVRNTLDSIYVKSLTARTYQLPWNAITRVEKTNVSDSSAILDVITLKTGEQHKGKVLYQVMGDKMVLRNTEGEIHHIPNSTISSISQAWENGADWQAHCALLDRIVLKDGKVLKGIITSRVMGKELTILSLADMGTTTVSLADIARYQKTQNRKYIPLTNALDTNVLTQVYLNDQLVIVDTLSKTADECLVKERNLTTIKRGEVIVIKTKDVSKFNVYVYPLKEIKNGKPSLPYFSLKKDAEIEKESSKETDEENAEVRFSINEKGKYIILTNKASLAETGIIINIE